MRINQNGLQMYTFDGHGHSKASDGLHTPEKIIDSAIQKGLQIVGLSDHNIITSLPRFLDYADKINKQNMKILPIPGVEISTTKGHILVLLPIRDKAEQFIENFEKPQTKPHPADFIEEFIRKYEAVVIFVHPDLIIHGITSNEIQRLLNKIPKSLHKNLGIEVYNWMAQALFWSRAENEHRIHLANHSLELAPFSFTDYHSANHVGNGSTAMYMRELTGHEFLLSVQNRRTAPLNTSNRGISEYLEIVKATLLAEAMSRTNSAFHIAKK